MRACASLLAAFACTVLMYAVPAQAQQPAPAPTPAAACPDCEGLRLALDAYKQLLKSIEQGITTRTGEMNDLVKKGLDNPPLTRADRDRIKQLDDELQQLQRAKDAWQKTIDDASRDLDDCNKRCVPPAAGTEVGVVPGATARPAGEPLRALCQACEAQALVANALVGAVASGTATRDAARTNLDALTRQAATSGQTREQYAAIQAARERLKRAERVLRELDWQAKRAAQALTECNQKACQVRDGSRLFIYVLTGGAAFRDDYDEDSYRPPLKRVDCPACGAEFDAVERAAARHAQARKSEAAAAEAFYAKRQELLRAQDNHDQLSRQLQQAHVNLLGAERIARLAELQAQITAVDRRIDALAAELRPLRDAYEIARDALRAARADEHAAYVALDKCLREKCGDVQVGGVIGRTGTNPFNPANPVGTSFPAWGLVRFSSPTFTGAEGGAVLIVVARTDGSVGQIAVDYEMQPGSASAGADFTSARGSLYWLDGDATPKSFSIALPEDTAIEGSESFTVALSHPFGGAQLGNPSTATVTIADNDGSTVPQPAGNLQFSASSYSTAEGQGPTVTITVTRMGGTSGEVTVQYFTGPSSATAGADYQAVNGVLSWGVGDAASKTFTVPIVDDNNPEGAETFFVTLNGPTGGATLGAPATATVTIADNDSATTGPCGSQGNAWQPNTGNYACSGSCSPSPSPQALSVAGDRVTLNPFHAGGAATFTGCSNLLNSDSSTLTYFGQANHSATINRFTNNSFSANITSSGGGTCFFSCSRSGP